MWSPSDRQGSFFPHQPPSFPRLGVDAQRIGVIDVGSNTVRLMVFEGGRRSPAVVFNEKVMCGLGAGLAETGKLDPSGRARAMTTLKRFAAITPALHVGALSGVATAAMRDAEDGVAFRDEVAAETGLELDIVSGPTEARLAAQGVIFGSPRAHGVVADLGGASMELCRIDHGRPGLAVSTPLGPLRLQALRDDRKALQAALSAETKELGDDFKLDGERLYLVGGAWRALARARMVRTDYPLRVLHEYVLTADEAEEMAVWAENTDPDKIAALPMVSASRAPVLPMAARLLRHLIGVLSPGEVMLSGFGLREGVCLENMPATLRARDPLLAACERQEQNRARAPGFGAELAEWVVQVVPPRNAAEERLVRASAHLVDVNWRIHPDYRINGCWETVTRTTITDAGHQGRVFMGLVLASRYKRARRAAEDTPLTELLDETELARAFCYGTAFRLGAVLAGATPGVLPDCIVSCDPGRLDLTLEGIAADFAGEEVDKRFAQLLRELDAEGVIRLMP